MPTVVHGRLYVAPKIELRSAFCKVVRGGAITSHKYQQHFVYIFEKMPQVFL